MLESWTVGTFPATRIVNRLRTEQTTLKRVSTPRLQFHVQKQTQIKNNFVLYLWVHKNSGIIQEFSGFLFNT
jgi:hypothetical protein